MFEASRRPAKENEGVRLSDIAVAGQLGMQMLGGIPDLQNISGTDFTNAQLPEIEGAWERMQGAYGALVSYYEYFAYMQPPHQPGQDWKEIQPYASIRGLLSSREETVRRCFHHQWAQQHRKAFHEVANNLLRIIASDFKLPKSILEPDISPEERVHILEKQTGSELFGLRFLPVYRKLFSVEDDGSNQQLHTPPEVEILWDPDDPLNRITFLKNQRPYYVGSVGSPYSLENLLDNTVLATGVKYDPSPKTENPSPVPIPVIDVDDTLTDSYFSDYVFTPQAKDLLSHLDAHQIPYVLWSRAAPHRIQWITEEIARQHHTAPQLTCHFDTRSWPFQTIKKVARYNSFRPDSFHPDPPEEIARQVNQAIAALSIDPQEAGFEDAGQLVRLISDFVTAFAGNNTYSFEYILQGKCPWFIPFSDVGSRLEPDFAKALLTRGVLFDDRSNTVFNAHYLGFNFVHVPSPRLLANAPAFLS